MEDIEDLHRRSCTRSRALPRDKHARRLLTISHHVSDPCDTCVLSAMRCDAAAHMSPPSVGTQLDLQIAMTSTGWPIKNSYGGRTVDIEEIATIHARLRSQGGLLPELQRVGVDSNLLQAMQSGAGGAGRGGGAALTGSSDDMGPLSLIKRLRQEGQSKLQDFVDANWPFDPRRAKRSKKWSNAKQHSEALEQFVANIRQGKPSMFAKPLVLSGYKTHVDMARFHAEIATFSAQVNIVGLSQDLPQANTYQRVDAFGKSMVLTRDKDGKFHCFENSCRHRGAQLVTQGAERGNKALLVCPYHSWAYGTDGALVNVPFEEGFDHAADVDIENRNLIELPSAEQKGILFVIPSPKPGVKLEDMADIVAQAMSSDLMEELDTLELEHLKCVIEQDMTIKANWKMGIDTFCETYHFSTLHPGLREFLVPGIQVFKTYGEGSEDARNARMTLGQFTTSLMANGEVSPEQIAQTDPLNHLVQVYHLAPNVVWNIGSNGEIDWFQFWPGSTPGQSKCTYRRYLPNEAVKMFESTPQMRPMLVAQNFGIMQVVVCEDFDLLPRMHQNYEKNTISEMVFGRNEPCLQNRHKYYMRALRENGYEDVL